MILNILLFLFLLLGIVVIHEFGHFVAARFFGVYCSEFSIGMGPLVYRHKGKETDFCIRALPLGGFVAMAGDSENDLESKVEVDVPYERTLPGIAPWKQTVVMFAGIFMNFVLAIVIMAGLFLHYGAVYEAPEAVFATVVADSPAEAAGMMAGDRVVRVYYDNGYSMKPANFDEMGDFMLTFDGEGMMHFEIERNGQIIDIDVDPQYSEDTGHYVIGVTAVRDKVLKVNIFNCWGLAVSYLSEIVKMVLITFAGLFRGVGLNNVSGPVGIYNATSEAVSYGFDSYLNLMAVISVNIGIFNALPLPVMDGGRVVLLLIETVMGRKINEKIVNAIMSVSVILLLMLMVFATGQDILRLF